MSITNAQYDEIMREYEQTQNANRHLHDTRLAEVFAKIPEFKALDSSVATISLEQGKKLIEGDLDALCVLRNKIKELSAKKKSLLLANGFNEDYLEPIYSCSACKDTGYVNNEKCNCFKQRILKIIYSQSNIEERLKLENFDTLDMDYYGDSELEKMKDIIDSCRAFADNFENTYDNMFLYGSVGAGKTFLTNCIAKEILDKGHSVIYFTAQQLFDKLAKYAFRAETAEENIDKMHEDVFNCDLLIIDDLGTELINSFVQSQLFMIVNERDLRRKSTIISTNYALSDIRTLYSERISSRIFSKYQLKEFEVADLRVKMKRYKM